MIENMHQTKDKLDNMDVQLRLDVGGPWFSQGYCDPMGEHICNPKVPNERYGHGLSNDTLCFFADSVVQSEC